MALLPLSAWAEIRKHLEDARYRIIQEIGNYPTPIPACDQDYNHMLAQRERLNEELARLGEFEKRSAAAEYPGTLVEAFIRSSQCIDAAEKRRLRGT